MNIDTINYGPFRVTRHKNGAETVMDTRDGTATQMRKTLAEIREEIRLTANSNELAYDAMVKALAAQHDPLAA